MNNTEIKKYIQHCLVERDNMSMRTLAKKMNTTPQNLNGIFTNNNFKISTLESIADALDSDLQVSFIARETGKPLC